MNFTMLKTSMLALITVITLSCSKSSSSSTDTGGSSSTTTNTWVKLTATNSSGVNKPNYIIMMFDQPVTSTSALPPIKRQVTTDANGLAYFDLNAMITSTTPTKYYFEAFVQSGANYIWKSVTNYDVDLAKGTMATSTIIVND